MFHGPLPVPLNIKNTLHLKKNWEFKKKHTKNKQHPEATQKDSLNFVYELKQIKVEGYSSEIDLRVSFHSGPHLIYPPGTWNYSL